MHKVLILGAGKIGSLIAFLLANSKDYMVYLADVSFEKRPDLQRILDKTTNIATVSVSAQDTDKMRDFLKKNPMQAIISCLPFHFNIDVAKLAKEFNLHYFDLTEDTHTAKTILELSQGADNAFVPQCGLAPGFISIVTNDVMKNFPELDAVKMRVGALPVNITNALQYSLTWSTDGLINEYGNLCNAIENGEEVERLPLEDLEEIKIDGLTYEAFNTSGGIGSLAKTFQGKVDHMSYKTIRYPGHCEKMRFLMNDLHLNHDRDTLKHILEKVIPKTQQDVVLVYVSVTGTKDHLYTEQNYFKKFYPKTIDGFHWTAIQLTTASGLCAVLDMVLSKPQDFHGHIRQEQFTLDQLTNNRFGQYFI
jgi:saccharopine dehydrogenase-like NADP-dependent oxidoreductase